MCEATANISKRNNLPEFQQVIAVKYPDLAVDCIRVLTDFAIAVAE